VTATENIYSNPLAIGLAEFVVATLLLQFLIRDCLVQAITEIDLEVAKDIKEIEL
jgi:hypothetical protein